MNKFLKALLVLSILFTAPRLVFAAAATVTATEYGYTITGGTSATLIPQDTWVTSTAYTVGARVTNGGHVYRCLIAHTSGTFSTDLTNLDWVKTGEQTLWVYKAVINPASSTDTAVFTSGASNLAAFFISGTWNTQDFAIPTGNSVAFTNLKITLTSASDVVYLYVNRDKTNQ